MQVWHMSAHTAQLLKATSREKGFYHPDVRALRMQLRLALEACLLDDYSTAQVCVRLLPPVICHFWDGALATLGAGCYSIGNLVPFVQEVQLALQSAQAFHAHWAKVG